MTLLAIWKPMAKWSTQNNVYLNERIGTSELVVASDSRLSGGVRWDCCPKIFPLDRKDCVICFTGSTYYAYPIILQIQKYINMHDKIKSRAIDISDLAKPILNIVNDMYGAVYDFPSCGQEDPDVNFVFAGYSCKFKNFIVRHFRYEQASKCFVVERLPDRKFHFFGDETREATIKSLRMLMPQKNVRRRISMEPLHVLIEMIGSPEFDSIGGAPQIYKLYPFANNIPLNVFWPSKRTGGIYFCGRKLLQYEKNKYLVIDPENFEMTKPVFSYSKNTQELRRDLIHSLLRILNNKL